MSTFNHRLTAFNLQYRWADIARSWHVASALTILMFALLDTRAVAESPSLQHSPPDFYVSVEGANPDDSIDDRQDIQDAISAAASWASQNNLIATVHFDAGVYDVASLYSSAGIRSLYLNQIDKVSLVGTTGTVLRFSNREAYGLHAFKCSVISIESIEFEYHVAPFTQGTIAGVCSMSADPLCTSNELRISVQSGYPNPSSGTFWAIPTSSSLYPAVQAHDPDTRLIKRESNMLKVDGISQDVNSGEIIVSLSASSDPFLFNYEVGDLITLKAAPEGGTRSMIWIDRCDTVTCKDLNILHSTSVGISHRFCRTMTIDGCKIIPKGDGLLSSNRGAIRNDMCFGPLVVKNCTIDRCGDDAITTPSKFGKVIAQTASDEFVADYGFVDELSAGHVIEFFDPNTHESEGCAVLGGAPVESYINETQVWTYMVQSPIAVEAGFLFEVHDLLANGFQISNNLISRHRARGILVKSSNGVIDNNEINGSTHEGIVVGPEFGSATTAGFARNVSVTNNRVRNVGHSKRAHDADYGYLGAITVSERPSSSTWPTGRENKNILIAGNEVVGAGLCGLFLGGVGQVEVKDNLFLNCQLYPNQTVGSSVGVPQSSYPLNTPVYAIEAQGLQFSGNKFEWNEPGGLHESAQPWFQNPNSELVDHAGSLRTSFFTFESDEDWNSLSGIYSLPTGSSSFPSVTVNDGPVVFKTHSMKVTNRDITNPRCIDLTGLYCDGDQDHVEFEVDNPRFVSFKIACNTSATDTWYSRVYIEGISGSSLAKTLISSIRNDSAFLVQGLAPSFLPVNLDLCEILGSDLQLGRYRVWIGREDVSSTSPSSPHLYIDDVGVAFEVISTTDFEPASGWPTLTGDTYSSTGSWSPSSLAGFPAVELDDWGLMGNGLDYTCFGGQGQGSRCSVENGSMTILNVRDPSQLSFQFAVNKPNLTGGTGMPGNDVAIQIRASSTGTWTDIGVVESQDMSGASVWEYMRFDFPITVAPGDYDVRIIRTGEYDSNLYNRVCIENLELLFGTSFIPYEMTSPPTE